MSAKMNIKKHINIEIPCKAAIVLQVFLYCFIILIFKE
jgi:hypothetical protein